MKLKNYLLIAALFLVNNYALFAQFAIPFTPRLAGGNIKAKRDVVLKVTKKTIFCKVALAIFMLFLITSSYSQTLKPFTPRFDGDVKGSMVMLGNAILGKDNNNYNVVSGALSFNENIDMKYIDIDSDPNTFSSSSANLIIPNPSCYRIAYAGLYWAATLQSGNRIDINKIKLKLPGGSYQNIIGEVVYDAIVQPLGTDKNTPYSCYADVTALLQSLPDAQGTYTVADVLATTGRNGTTGLSAGWNLIVVYEDPTKPSQSITTFDGFCGVDNGNSLTYKVSGFRARLSGPVNLAYAFAALEGDVDEVGTKLEVNNKAITTADRPSNHFFNSTIDNLAGPFTNRTPNSGNTLGFDSGIINVPNTSKNVVNNGDTEAYISVQLAGGQKGSVYSYFSAFAVDVIEPEILLTKQVQDAQGNDASTANVVLGQNLFYVIGFQNIGNDPATQFTIRDVLPNNIIFNYPADITYLPPGVTSTYNSATRSITFSIDKTLVEIGDPRYEIRFKVQVVPTCNQLSSACSNEIKNQAFATYRGVQNTLLVTDDPSLPSYTTCNITTAPSATNFLVGVSGCSYGDSQVLCGNNVLLTASNGYASYSWSRDPSGVPVIGTGQTYLATQLGKYYVHNTATPPCFLNIVEEITVVPFGNTVTNPVIPFADNVVTCPNDGKSLPLIYLCGANATRAIQTNVSDGSTIVWEKLNEASCAAVSNSNCANENSACTWTQVGTGPNYTATAAGQYRMTLNYSGGCFNRFYFNVYQNLLSPTVTKKDIVCNTPGRITVGGVPSGYEYSLSPTGPFLSSNVFDIPTQNLYTVYIRQVGVTSNPCLFTVPDIFIRKRNFTVSTVATAPLCNGGKGSLKLAANDVEPQYFYKISQGGVLINSVGPILASDYTFANLNPGVYDVEVSTQDGCIQAFQATVPDTPPLTATVTLTKPLTCTDGEITVFPVGGTPPYIYYINSSANYEALPQIVIPSGGNYTVDVYDFNGCTTRVSISVAAISPPTFDVVKTDLSCSYVVGDGTISLTNIVPNGNALRYSIDNGVTFLNSPIFTNLTAGNYNVVVEYTTGTSVCKTPPQSITITVPMAITGTATLTAPYTCLQTATIEAQSVSGGTGVYQYSINGTTFQASNVFTGLTNGTYTITIKDANNCTFVTNAVTVAPLTPPTDLSFSNSALTCPSNTSNVTLSATGGSGVKTYQITAPAGSATTYQASNVFSGLAPGTYTFQVKDAKDCTYQESYSIAPLPAVTVVGQVVSNVQCFGTNTGSIRFTVSGSTGFTYTINGVPQGVGASPINLINQAAGTYTIVITNTATNCTATTSVTITQPAVALSVTTTSTPIKCTANGSVVVNATGGWGGNTYTLTQPDATVVGPQPSNTFVNLTQPGTYTVSVTDSNNCTQTNTFILSTPAVPTASINPSSDLCFDGVNAAKIVVSATPGTGTILEYNINGGLFQASNTFANLSPGSYTVIVRDDYGCSVTLPTVTIAPQLAVSTVLTKDLDCNSPPEAVITSIISGGYTDYSYQMRFNGGSYGAVIPLGAGVSTITYSTLIAGDYQFQITDAKGCTTQSAIITVNPIVNPSATLTVINPSCNGFSDGSVQIAPSGGVGPYTYSFDGSPFTAVSLYPNLKAGILYAYEVRDSKNCPFTGTVTLTEPTALVATASATVFKCDATNTKQSATVTVTATSGTGTAPYQYSFDGGANYSTTNILTVNDNGSNQDVLYAVKDANGCTDGGMVTITKFNPPTDLTFTEPISVNCTEVKATATNGVEPLTYEITFPVAIANNTGIFPNLAAGTYVFKVTDANGCYYTESYTVTPIAVSGMKIADVKCFGDNDGAIRYTVSGNAIIGNYTYTLTSVKGTAIVPVQTGNTLDVTGLIADTYTMTVTDKDTGCTAFSTIEIIEPTAGLSITSAIATNVHCNNYNSQITVTASGGTPNYTYAAVISGAAAPTYSNSNIIIVDTNSGANLSWDVYVKDANGCVTNNTFSPTIVTLDPMPTVTTTTPLATDQCDSNGSSYSFTASGTGVAPLTYSIGGSFQASPVFTVTATGTYTITVKDGNGCTDTTNITVYPVLTATAVLTKDLDCSLSPNATVTINAGGGKALYTYLVSVDGGTTYGSAGISGNVFTTNSAGTFLFEVTDANGCKKVSNPITINPKEDPVITLLGQTQDIYCNGEATASIKVNIDTSKGIGPFTYSIDGTTFQASNVFSGLTAGTYTVTVKDSKGCPITDAITIEEPDALVFNTSETNIICGGGVVSLGTITIIGTPITGHGGSAPYTYVLTNNIGAVTQTELLNPGTSDFTFPIGLNFGTYTLSVVDANGCTKTKVISIASPPDEIQIDVAAVATGCTSEVLVTAIGPSLTTGPFYFSIYTDPSLTYPGPSWIPEDAVGSKKTTFSGLIQNVTYSFVVFDSSTGCYYYQQATTPTITTTNLVMVRVVTDVTCKGADNGNVVVTLNSGTATSIDYQVYNSQTNQPTSAPITGVAVPGYPFQLPVIGGLVPGSYYVVVTEHGDPPFEGCRIATTPFDIVEAATLLSVSASVVKNDNCNDNAGQIVAIAQGGATMSKSDPYVTPPIESVPVPYQYQILPDIGIIGTSDDIPPAASDGNWNTSNTFMKDSGNYIVYAMDANKCIKPFPITLDLDSSPAITLAVTDKCAVEGAFEIIVNEATVGVAPYSISVKKDGIVGAFQNISGLPYTLSNLNSGTYEITIKDVNGCIDPESITLYKKVSVNAQLTKEFDCTASPNAVITTNISNGLAPFTYRVNIDGLGYGGSNPVAGTSFTVSIAPTATATTYQFEITDFNSCIVETNVIMIEPIENPTATTIITNATCSATSNGSVTIIPSLGVPPYTYSFNGSGFTSDVTYGGLAGTVIGTVYNYQVKDSYDCIFNGTAIVFEPTPVAGTIALTQGLTCGAGNATQAATITVTPTPGSGTAPYYYSFDGGLSYSSNNVYTTNVAGNVNALIKDGNGCVIAAALTENVPALNPPTNLDFTSTAVTCLALKSDVTLTTTNGEGTLSYSILLPASATSNVSGASSGIFTGLLPNTYLFQVTDANGCSYQESYTVAPVKPITVAGQLIKDVSCNGGSDGSVQFTVSNFAGTYSYSINGIPIAVGQNSATINLTGLSIGNQVIDVSDEITGCTATVTLTVSQPPVLSLSLSTNVNANCNFNAQISVMAAGGTPGYKYSFVRDGFPAGVFANNNSAILDPGVDLNWDVWVMDAKGCTAKLDVAIVKDPLPTVTVPGAASNQCNTTGALYTFTAVGASGIPPYEYSIGNGYQVNPMFAVAIPAVPTSYTVTIKDANGCTSVSPTSVMIYAPLVLSANFTTSPTCNNTDGVITATATGGSTNYNYTLLDSTSAILVGPQASNVFSTLAAGSYQIKVTDLTTACEKTVAVVLSTPTPVTFTTSVTNVSCKGGNNGVIAVNLGPGINDNPVYTYEITPPIVRPAQNSNLFTGLSVGTYTVRVNSGRGCFSTDNNVVVTEPLLALSVSGTATPFACAPDNTKTASTVTVTELAGSGTPPYLYSVDGINYTSTNTFSVIDNGLNYALNVFVKDANGCVSNGSVPITSLIPLTGIVNLNTPIDCNGTGSIAVLANGGSGNYSYQLLPIGGAQPSNIFNIMNPGTYYFQVNDVVTGCSITTAAYTVAPFNTFDVVATATTPVTCFGDTNGAISINVTGYTGAFDYEVFDNLGSSIMTGSGIAPTTQLISGLQAGNFTVKVTEIMTPFCVKTSNGVTVASPALALAVVANETASVTCTNNRGTITATGTGGWGSLQYELVGPINVAYSTGSTFSNLVAGNYTVNVKDAKGCIRSSNLILSVPTPITVTASPNTTMLSCFGDKTATITVNLPSGGQGSNYSYTLNTTSLVPATASGPQASPVFGGLGAGTYTITVTDGYSCSATSAPIVIAQPTKVNASLVVATTQTCLTQTRLTLSATGGTGVYTYSADPAFTTVLGSFATSITFPVPVGTYVYYVRDANGCISNISNQITIDPLPVLNINLDKTNAVINCAGDNTGVIVATAQGGLGNYSYTLLNGSGAIVQGPKATGNFTGLFAGNYQVKVDSGDCTTQSAMISITQPLAPLTATYVTKEVTCNGANNGILMVNASGGTGIIKYAISPYLNQFFDTNVFDKLAPGNYDVIVQDVLGCYVKINFDITEPAPIVASTIPGTILPEICYGDKDGAFMIDVTGGVLPYSVSLDNPNGTYTTGTPTQTQFDFTGLTGGSHTVYIRDANACGVEWVVVLPESVKINPIAAVDYSCVNNAANNTVTVTADASITNPADLDYSLDGATYQTSNIFINVVPGVDHFIDVRHTNGCIQRTMNFDIAQIDPLVITLNDGGLNEIVAVTTGGAGGNQYTLNGESNGTKNTFIVYKSGDYTVGVIDTNGCSATASRHFEFIDIEIPNVFTPNGDGNNDGWGPSKTINYPDLIFDIYDRYGRKIATYKEGQYWDGKYNSLELPSGDYWYVLKLQNIKDAREFVGHFTLYR
ncbi:T9SS type B sorting domain-containing protein [Flavobacterium gawalongense]|uniref:T9SS type B sorting domain-containing protein n=1 Tax=Flavobacterium gawalongense TaxID=2594432 RepID=A0ABY3CND4_9FLAO|nr:T9SS type B sorting domain-containing protein [Flavobacterium gawalongense]TRX01680.1 T9SS type B sorting domain-containing protein [Flavobacterium gawalongense]TRX08446.1 T9SS type B sorting domain-containing protein [Flavobacterium gawalongense]